MNAFYRDTEEDPGHGIEIPLKHPTMTETPLKKFETGSRWAVAIELHDGLLTTGRKRKPKYYGHIRRRACKNIPAWNSTKEKEEMGGQPTRDSSPGPRQK